MDKFPFNIKDWFNTLQENISGLYNQKKSFPYHSDIQKTVNELLITNFTLWSYEDEARRTDVPDKKIAEIKRVIDKNNQKRNNLIDTIDALIKIDMENYFRDNDSLPLNSENPGSIFDRLTIMALRTFHLKKEIERKDIEPLHIEKCKNMIAQVSERAEDLLKCLDNLLNDYYSGRKRLKAYKQHKLYNDPALNPALRKQS